MGLVIELTPTLQQRLKRAAEQHGQTPGEYACSLVEQGLPDPEWQTRLSALVASFRRVSLRPARRRENRKRSALRVKKCG